MSYNILLLDDELPILTALRLYFQAKGCSVDSVQSLSEAEALLDKNHYDGVITDLRLSDSQSAEGLALLHRLQTDGHKTPVIMLTGHATPEVEKEACRLGVDAFLIKPRPMAEIAQILFRLMEKKS